jgi:glycosyltransferase involved in cell wall biosynthesis
LVGDGDNPFIDRCTEFINKNDILDNIIFHGRKSFNEDLFRLYKNADVFILPSHTEGFPRVVWEAALFTCPIIVTSVGGIPFVLKNNRDAIFIPPLNSEAISIALQKIIENYNEYKIMTTNAYNLALQNTLENGIKLFVNNIIMEFDNLS